MSVLFSDVRGFATICESLDPKQRTQPMNAFLTPLTGVIYRHRGTIDKDTGDCIMAFWGAPVAHAQRARNAVLAGLETLAANEPLLLNLPRTHSNIAPYPAFLECIAQLRKNPRGAGRDGTWAFDTR